MEFIRTATTWQITSGSKNIKAYPTLNISGSTSRITASVDYANERTNVYLLGGGLETAYTGSVPAQTSGETFTFLGGVGTKHAFTGSLTAAAGQSSFLVFSPAYENNSQKYVEWEFLVAFYQGNNLVYLAEGNSVSFVKDINYHYQAHQSISELLNESTGALDLDWFTFNGSAPAYVVGVSKSCAYDVHYKAIVTANMYTTASI